MIKRMTFLIVTGCFAFSAIADNTPVAPATIQLSPPSQAPVGMIKTPVDGYYIDMNSIKFHQMGSQIIGYDMITNLTEGSNRLSADANLYSHSMRSHYLLNCDVGEDSVNGINIYPEFFGNGQSMAAIPQPLSWQKLQDQSLKTFFSKMVCVRLNQNYKGQTPEQTKQEIDSLGKM